MSPCLAYGANLLPKFFHDGLEGEHQVFALHLVHQLEELVEQLWEDRSKLRDVVGGFDERSERHDGVDLDRQLRILHARFTTEPNSDMKFCGLANSISAYTPAHQAALARTCP